MPPADSDGSQLGVPSETHWIRPDGLGSFHLPPEHAALSSEIGELRQDTFPVRPGLELYKYTAELRSPVILSCKVLTQEPYLWLSFNFSGQSTYDGNRLSGSVLPELSYYAPFRDPLTRILHKPGRHEAAGLFITPSYMARIVQGQRLPPSIAAFLEGSFDPEVAATKVTATMRQIAHQICHHPYEGPLAAVFLEAKAYEMLAECWRVMLDAGRHRDPSGVRRCALAAREIIMANLANPPRIADVAQQVGLSQRRLTEVFQEIFSASPLQCMVRWRLDRAHELLEVGELTVKQVAHETGYAHVSNFSLAFSRTFGYPPTAVPRR